MSLLSQHTRVMMSSYVTKVQEQDSSIVPFLTCNKTETLSKLVCYNETEIEMFKMFKPICKTFA